MKEQMQTPDDVLLDRNHRYGQAWLDAGTVIQVVLPQFLSFVRDAPLFVHNWVIILSKMIRILTTPYDRDHWLDIRNYAELIVRYLDENSSTEDRDGQVH